MHCICGVKIRRSWHGRSKVRSIIIAIRMAPKVTGRSLRPLVVSLFPGQQRLLNQLKQQRAALANELTDVINEFGPKLYEDFDQVRIQSLAV